MSSNKDDNLQERPDESDPEITPYRYDSQQTARTLELAVAQLEMSVKDADSSIETLIDSIISMAGNFRNIERESCNSSEHHMHDTIATNIREYCAKADLELQRAITAFQFYDKLSQRLTHIGDCLAALTELVTTPQAQLSPDPWHALQEKARSVYSMEQEQVMFKTLTSGLTADKARELIEEKNLSTEFTDIELF